MVKQTTKGGKPAQRTCVRRREREKKMGEPKTEGAQGQKTYHGNPQIILDTLKSSIHMTENGQKLDPFGNLTTEDLEALSQRDEKGIEEHLGLYFAALNNAQKIDSVVAVELIEGTKTLLNPENTVRIRNIYTFLDNILLSSDEGKLEVDGSAVSAIVTRLMEISEEVNLPTIVEIIVQGKQMDTEDLISVVMIGTNITSQFSPEIQTAYEQELEIIKAGEPSSLRGNEQMIKPKEPERKYTMSSESLEGNPEVILNNLLARVEWLVGHEELAALENLTAADLETLSQSYERGINEALIRYSGSLGIAKEICPAMVPVLIKNAKVLLNSMGISMSVDDFLEGVKESLEGYPFEKTSESDAAIAVVERLLTISDYVRLPSIIKLLTTKGEGYVLKALNEGYSLTPDPMYPELQKAVVEEFQSLGIEQVQ